MAAKKTSALTEITELISTLELFFYDPAGATAALKNRRGTLDSLINFLAASGGGLMADGAVAGTAIQELLGLNLTDPTELTIASGAITLTQGAHTVDTEGDASSDDLVTITAAKGVGDFAIIIPAHTDRSIVLKHGTGNIYTFNGSDITLDTVDHWAILFRNGTRWIVMANSAGGGAGNLKADGTVAGTAIQELLGLNLTDPTELTIASGAITLTQGAHTVDTEGDASSDDLVTITAAKGVGDVVVLVPADDARSIVLKHGTGNIHTFNGTDITLDTDDHWALLFRIGSRWVVMANSAGGGTGNLKADGTVAGTAIQELLGLNLTDPTELTIASGAITLTQGAHTVDTEGDASSDDLVTITAAKGVGDVVVLVPADDARSIVLKHGTGNIHTFNGTDITLDTDDHWALLFRIGSRWVVMANSAGGSSLPVVDTTALVSDPSDSTKRVRIDAGAVQAGATRAIQVPNGDCRIRDCRLFNLLGPTEAWTTSDLFVWICPTTFIVERAFASCYSAGSILETPSCEILKNGEPWIGSISLSTAHNNGSGKTGFLDGPFSVAAGDVLTASLLNTGAGSAGLPAEGLQINLVGYWSLV